MGPLSFARHRGQRRQRATGHFDVRLLLAAASILVAAIAFGLALLLPQAGLAQTAAKPFSNEQLEQMTAPVALYPDSLLAQLFMATTYPDDFAAAAAWSKAHPNDKGDAAVKLVENQPWDPSVASLVAPAPCVSVAWPSVGVAPDSLGGTAAVCSSVVCPSAA